ncbi:MAG: AbrB/MazE/SpoVT family DNA-binding domain-containing protein [Chloroflexota bacterium]|nr:AbrB/MazE/SpoVT family DNA-binding domain-containing protein [Chloroflexota bacterium]
MTVKVSQKGWVVIPVALRKKYLLEPGTNLKVVDYGGVLALIPVLGDPIEEAAGMLEGESSMTQALLDDRMAEQKHER